MYISSGRINVMDTIKNPSSTICTFHIYTVRCNTF